MALTNIYCEDFDLRRQDKKLPVSTQDCLDCALTRENNCQWTYEILKSMYDRQEDRGDLISATAIIGECVRSLVLERKEEYNEWPSKLWASFRGTMIHEQLEGAVAPGSVAELRYFTLIEGVGEFSCKPDLIDIARGRLYDYKTKIDLPPFNYPYRDHGIQLNINRFIVDHAVSVEIEGEKVPIAEAEDRLGMSLKPEEWQELIIVYVSPSDGVKTLPVTKSVPGVKRDGSPSLRNMRVPDIWSDEQALDYIVERYQYIRESFDSYPENIPPVPDGWEGMTGWKCSYCPVRARCHELSMEGK